MSIPLRILPCGADALLLETPDTGATRALFAVLSATKINGITRLFPAARTVFLAYDPEVLPFDNLLDRISQLTLATKQPQSGRTHRIPVVYDGPDLDEVAAHLDLTRAEVIERHQTAQFTVDFCGFAPGFAYLSCDEPLFDLPRRATPRPRVGSGAVALAGRYGAVYPSDSAGGWQLIGRTDQPMWDIHRSPPALLQAGDHLRFHAVESLAPIPPKPATFDPKGPQSLRIDMTWQPLPLVDLGRPQAFTDAVPTSGALDRDAFGRANHALGNLPQAPAIEIAAPIHVTALQPEVLVITGAEMKAKLITLSGSQYFLNHHEPFALDAGDRIELAAPSTGRVAYLARRGGFDVERVLGSASSDTLSGIGPQPLATQSILHAAQMTQSAVMPSLPAPVLPCAGDEITVSLLPGPRMDWFSDAAIAALINETWTVSTEITRVGLRLNGPHLPRKRTGELASEVVLPGAIQIPHDGRPMVFLRDAPVTGGYPVIAIIPEDELSRIAQCPPATRLRFTLCKPFAATQLRLATGQT